MSQLPPRQALSALHSRQRTSRHLAHPERQFSETVDSQSMVSRDKNRTAPIAVLPNQIFQKCDTPDIERCEGFIQHPKPRF